MFFLVPGASKSYSHHHNQRQGRDVAQEFFSEPPPTMALKKCRECGQQVSSSASTCPHCGARQPTFPWGALILGAIVCAGIAVWYWATA